MKTPFGPVVVATLAALLAAGPAHAVGLGFAPSSQTVAVGDAVSVDVVISGLGAGLAPSLGAFDLDVTFDPLLLAPTGVTFGLFLGDPALGDALAAFVLAPGVVDLAEVSFLAPADLDALQPAAFTLATLTFATLAAGTSPLAFAQAVLDDAFAVRLATDTAGGSITALAASPVPLPATLLLLAAGAAVLALRRAAVPGAASPRA